MKQSTFFSKTNRVICAAAIVLAMGLFSCNDDKKPEVKPGDSTALTPPVIVKDSPAVMKKDSLPKGPNDSTKTDQVPPPRNH